MAGALLREPVVVVVLLGLAHAGWRWVADQLYMFNEYETESKSRAWHARSKQNVAAPDGNVPGSPPSIQSTYLQLPGADESHWRGKRWHMHCSSKC